jgi:3',5'-cyclic-AMP phosphodiesterase
VKSFKQVFEKVIELLHEKQTCAIFATLNEIPDYRPMKTLKRIVVYFYLPLTLIFTQSVAQFTFVHISDLHISNGPSEVNNSDTSGLIFSQMLSTINNLDPKPAFVVASGDISNVGSSGDGMYSIMTQYLFPSQITNPGNGDLYIDPAQTIPIYYVPGNHDYLSTIVPPLPTAGLNNYSAYVSPAADYYIVHGNAVIIFLLSGDDQYRPLWVDINVQEPEGSGLTNDQINWLRNVLKNNAGKKKIIVMHHPPVNALGTNANGTPNTGTMVDAADGSIINNREEFLNICDSDNVDIVLAGHVHQNVVASRPGTVVDENWTAGTRYIQTAACEYKGYRIITVDSSFVWAGKPQILSAAGINEFPSSAENASMNVTYDHSLKTITVLFHGLKDQSAGDLALYNIMGQQLINEELIAHNGKQITINTEGLSKGLCLLTWENTERVITEKVMVY